MAQVGRISGPLLEANLLRQGIANGTQANLSFKNNAGDQSLLKIDVTNGRIGVDVEAPANELQVSQTVQTVDLIGDTAGVANYTISTNNINVDSGSIYLDAGEHIQLSNLETEQFYITDNYISTNNTNTNIDLVPNGTGTVEVQSNLNIYGDLHSTNNITLEGNIIFGDTGDDSTALTDTVTFDADINSDIIPNVTDTYTFGSIQKNWDNIDTKLVNGQLLDVAVVSIGGIDLTARPGNIFYVAKDGTNTNVGDHINGALLTIEEALSRADASTDGPVTIKILPGVYEENLPLVVPNRVSIMGDGSRSVTVKPAAGSESKDVFHLDDSTMISKLTIKDYQYNSGNNTGYAFRFAPNAVITNRSPYIQDVTIITQGTPITVTASSTFSVNSQETHPRGITFNNDGTKMFIVGEIGDDVNEYTLSTGFDLSSIVTFVDSFAVTQCPNPTAVKFNADGTKMFVTGTNNSNVHQYALTTGFDVSSASFTQTLVTTVDSDNFGLDFKPDGTKMYITGDQNNKIYEYNLSSAFDISSATFNQDLTLTAIDSEPFGIEWSTDGTRLFIVGTSGNGVDEFAVGAPYDISTLTHIGFYSIGGNPSGIHISPDGTKMFIIGNQSDTVKSYDLSVSYRIKVPTDDPRGFAQGDAGKGAWIDGAELNSASVEASMLFHSATFITPGVDAITMTNGVRVEWLNSFSYFANRGLYAVRGSTGRTSYDGSTVNYGAEVRSIGSANVYGNYGAVADGADTLMYLIQHNFGYIGAGKFADNDDSRAIQSQEVAELNSGKINFVTTDHTGGFRIGDNFFVDFATGNTTINIDTLSVNQFNALRVNTGASTTTIDGAFIETGNLIIANNLIQTDTGDLNLASSTGTINLQDNTNITGTLDISGDFSFDGALNIGGDQATDSLTFNAALDQDFNPNQHQKFALGSFAKKWLIAHLDKLETPDIDVYDNVIETTTSNADLELRANGTGKIRITDSARFTDNLTISGTTNILDSIGITSVLPIVGDVNQTGNFTISEDADIDQNINVGASAQFEEILVDDNFITTTTSNTALELRAAGTGTVNIQETVNVANDLTSHNTTATNANITLNITTDNANIGNVEINDNYIKTTNVNGNLILVADRNVVVTGTDVTLAQDLTVQGATDVQALDITGALTHTGAYNQTGDYTIGGELTVDNVYIEDNFITTTSGNLILEATGNIDIDSNNVEIANDLDVDGITNLDITNINGTLTHVGNRTQTGNFVIGGELTVDNVYVEDNFITTTAGNLILGATGDINVDVNDVVITNDLTVGNTTSLQGTSITGTLVHVGNTNQTGNLNIAGEISNGNILFEDNFISTTNTNSDLELRANGTGEVVIDTADTLTIQNNLTVGGTLTYQGFLTINGDVALLGNTQDGSLTVTNDFDVTGTLDISSQSQFEDVRIEDNFVTTTLSNSNLELRANGTGEVLIPNNNVQVTNDLFAASISTGDINVNNDLVLDELEITDSNIEINENYIATKTSNSNLELRASASGVIDPEYNNGAIINLTGNGSDFFSREVTVNGVRIVAAGTVGGQTAVPDAFVEKVARMFELFTDVNGAGINETSQRTFIKTLSGDAGTYHAAVGPTLQRVARGAGADYTPNFLTDAGIASYNLSPLFDSHVANDMVWYLNSTGDAPGDGDNDAQEVIEHVFHTLHMHGLDAVSLKMYSYISADWASGPLYAAMEEAYDAGKWDSSGYVGNAWKTDGDAFEVSAKEYLFLLNFGMFEYSSL